MDKQGEQRMQFERRWTFFFVLNLDQPCYKLIQDGYTKKIAFLTLCNTNNFNNIFRFYSQISMALFLPSVFVSMGKNSMIILEKKGTFMIV